jgi:hypothetical protein
VRRIDILNFWVKGGSSSSWIDIYEFNLFNLSFYILIRYTPTYIATDHHMNYNYNYGYNYNQVGKLL